jgi:TPR repeat protein
MGTEIDPSQAKYWFKKAIEMGNIESKFRLAELLEDNSHRQARKLILEIISNTHLLSPYQKVKLAKMMYDQRFGLQRDGDTIFTLCTQANDHRWLGICYDDGLGVKPNYTKAREHFECAIEEARSSGKSVDSEIFHRLGLIYFKGKEVLQNNDQAVFYLEKAVQGGNLNAMSTLAHIVEKGWENVKPDSQKAMELYTQAAQAGDMIGQYNLGFFYANERNNQEARFWLEKAQNQGYHLSKDILLLLNLFDDKKPEPQTIQELITLLSTEASFSHNMIIQTISKLLPYILDISDQKLQKSFKKQLEALLIPISEDKDIFLSGCAGYLLIYLESVSKISEEVSNSPQKQDNVSLEIQEAMERRKIEKLREKEIKQRAYLEKIRTKNIPSVEITQEIKNLKNSFTPRQIEELEEFINHKGVVKTQELSKILSILDAQRTANGYKIEIGDIITTFHTQHGRDSNVVDPAIVKSIKAGLKESGI